MTRHRGILISNMYPTKRAPAFGTFVERIATGLAQCGVAWTRTVVLAPSRSKPRLAYEYIRYFLRAFFAVAFTSHYDFVYTHYVSHTPPLLCVAASLRGKPIAVNVHGSDLMRAARQRLVNRAIARRTMQRADLVVVPSDYFANVVKDDFRVQAHSVFVSASGGIGREFFGPTPERFMEGSPVVGYLSRLTVRKGLALVRDMATLARDHHPNWRFAIAGPPEDNDSLDMVRSLCLHANVNYRGALRASEVPEFLDSIDLVVIPSQVVESLNLTAIEAMARGVPVVASDIGALGDHIRKSGCGEAIPMEQYGPSSFMSAVDRQLNKLERPSHVIRADCRAYARRFESTKVCSDLAIRFGALR